ncbi:AbrB/MazE/SpoVT family DNA-binding domain-containing protein [Methylobacterium sp. NEAU 140]|uniref:antitoxin n=1 Tax=Methylobacterium sp. NEAU 140 TaxID=3064945 RepID=UPI0027359B5A|nr:AbrB/MazE/SpoVT family DNA-binding domain-containing protein [Methylobacterium sp. NEAU 140]MDP4026994.1 AbrB/MazE/SpoVT family DNA-binding domain-containing protein [Methylobacterium sp. NEAU 140]
MMERTARLFTNNHMQAVRIPRDFELPGTRVKISKLDDGRLVIEPLPDGRLLAALKGAQPLAPEDWMDPIEHLPAEPVEL